MDNSQPFPRIFARFPHGKNPSRPFTCPSFDPHQSHCIVTSPLHCPHQCIAQPTFPTPFTLSPENFLSDHLSHIWLHPRVFYFLPMVFTTKDRPWHVLTCVASSFKEFETADKWGVGARVSEVRQTMHRFRLVCYTLSAGSRLFILAPQTSQT